MQSSISVANGAITGTLKYMGEDNAITQVWGAGNFLCLKFADADIENQTVKVGLNPSVSSGLVELDADKNGIFKVTDKMHQKLVVLQIKDGVSQLTSYDLSGLTCNAE